MTNTADMTNGKPIAVWSPISGVSAINPLVAFYEIFERKGVVLIFYFIPDITRYLRDAYVLLIFGKT
jgi:hypothetical protein